MSSPGLTGPRWTGPADMFGRTLPAATALAAVVAIATALLSPPDSLQGELVRLMYVHVPAAWTAFLAYAVTLLGGLLWLFRRTTVWDRLAAASAEAGVFFTGLAIAMGSIWGRPTWGVWWTWDARLVTTALLFFVYLGYLALRRAVDDPVARARRSAVFGVVAFAMVPLVHFSVVWWRTLHQPATLLRPEAPAIGGAMLVALLLSLIAFTLVYALIVRTRMRLGAAEDDLTSTELAEPGPVAGDAITPPRQEGAGSA